MERKNNQAHSEWKSQFPALDKGWAWVVLGASFGSFMLLGGTQYAVGIIHLALLERYKEEVSKTAWTGALQSALVSVGGLFNICILSRLFEPRRE